MGRDSRRDPGGRFQGTEEVGELLADTAVGHGRTGRGRRANLLFEAGPESRADSVP